jgi:hypothetical protein
VPAAPLDERLAAEHRADRLVQGLAAVDDEQDPFGGVQAPLGKVSHQPGAHRLVLGGALGHPEGDLGAISGHAQRADQQVLAHPEAVQEHHHEALLVQRAASNCASRSAVAATNRRETADFDVPDAACSTWWPTGSSPAV